MSDFSLENPEAVQQPLIRMTHTECVTAATKYIVKRYPVTLAEFYTHNAELPDVIGFKDLLSVVVECKVSRSDFLSDRKKPFRVNPEKGMGDHRFYCCPKGLIQRDELPDGWGLLWIYPNGQVRRIKESYVHDHDNEPYNWRTHGKFKKDKDSELYLLYYYARRAYYAGVHNTIIEYRGYDG
jgi:hypothetical protein